MPRLSYLEITKERRIWYKTIKKIYCPCLKNDVVFNSKGFYHLRYDSSGRMRPKKEQMYKIGLLPLVIPVVKGAQKIYEYTPSYYSKKLGKYVEYWALKEQVGRQKTIVTVILRRIGTGYITFHSVMKKNDQKLKKPRK